MPRKIRTALNWYHLCRQKYFTGSNWLAPRGLIFCVSMAQQAVRLQGVELFAMGFHVSHLDHMQIAAPEGCEAKAREFYGTILGMREMEKPAALRGRGGCWFQCGEQQFHIGVERDFKPARKAHPAFAVFDLEELREELLAKGIAVIDDEALPNTKRFYTEDPWGNRLEFLEVEP